LIIDGKIHLKQCAKGVVGFDERHVVLGDGTRIKADIVVLANGVSWGARVSAQGSGPGCCKSMQ
jgi:hypothetical protein